MKWFKVPVARIVEVGRSTLYLRIANCVRTAIPSALKTAIWFLKITIPISLAVTLLNYFGVLTYLSQYLSPAFNLIGLRGEAALVYITSAFLNVYSAIAVMSSISFTMREITILAIMSLIAHNLIVETAVQKKTGSKAWQILLLRIVCSVVAAFLLNVLLPAQLTSSGSVVHQDLNPTLRAILSTWVISALKLSIKMVVLITLLMILQKILIEFKITNILSDIFSPLLKLMGLPKTTSFLWIVANLLGLTYGSAVMIEESQSGRLTKHDADLLNYHIAISHSNLEDLILFAAIGVSAWWLLLPRLGIAMVAVWGRRFSLKS